jgi:hypothetical protein
VSPDHREVPGTGRDHLIDDLLNYLAVHRASADMELIMRAYEAAAHWHHGQFRKSGDPYITHPVAVAMILAQARADDASLCAALLHDVVDDTPCSLDMLRSEFGAEVTDLVTAVMAPLRVALAQTTSDKRVLLVKLADRLHNMRTIEHLPQPSQVRNSSETLEWLVPAARAMRAGAIARELEQLAATTLRRHGQRPEGASGRVLALSAVVLPASSRARWREEWLAELSTLPTRRKRARYVAGILLGMGKMAAAVYRPATALKHAISVVAVAVIPTSGLILGGWQEVAAVAVTVLSVLAAITWILRSDERTSRLAHLIRSFRNPPDQ